MRGNGRRPCNGPLTTDAAECLDCGFRLVRHGRKATTYAVDGAIGVPHIQSPPAPGLIFPARFPFLLTNEVHRMRRFATWTTVAVALLPVGIASTAPAHESD